MSGQAKASDGAQEYRRAFAISLRLEGRPQGLGKQQLSAPASVFIATSELSKRYANIPQDHDRAVLYAKLSLDEDESTWLLTVAYKDEAVYKRVLDAIPNDDLIGEIPARIISGKLYGVGSRWNDAAVLREEVLRVAGLPDTAFLKLSPVTDRSCGIFTGTYRFTTTPDHLVQIVLAKPSQLFQRGEPQIEANLKASTCPSCLQPCKNGNTCRSPPSCVACRRPGAFVGDCGCDSKALLQKYECPCCGQVGHHWYYACQKFLCPRRLRPGDVVNQLVKAKYLAAVKGGPKKPVPQPLLRPQQLRQESRRDDASVTRVGRLPLGRMPRH